MSVSVPDGKGGEIESGSLTLEDMKAMNKNLQSGNGRHGMKPDKEFDAARDNTYRVTAGELRSFVEKIERVSSDIAVLRDDMKNFYAEAKGRGYNTKALRKIIAERKRDKDDLAEEQAVMVFYREALGM